MHALQQFADNVLFNINIPIAIFDPETFAIFFPNMSMDRFREDRAAMRKGGTVRRGTLAECRAAYDYVTPRLENQLAERPYLLGERPCAADFAVYHNYWPIARVPKLASLLEPYQRLSAWMDRMQAIGHGAFSSMSSGEALEVARSSEAQLIRNGAVAHGDGARRSITPLIPCAGRCSIAASTRSRCGAPTRGQETSWFTFREPDSS